MDRVSQWWSKIWRIEARALSPVAAFFLKVVRVSLLTVQEFFNDRVTLRASAMTFYSLLAIVPIAILAVAMTGLVQLDDDLIRAVYDAFPEQRVIIEQVLTLAYTVIQTAHTQLIAATGIVVAFWSITKLLIHMDRSFSDIWGVRSSRRWWRRIVDYLTLFVVLPLFLLLSSAITIFLNHELEWLRGQESFLNYFGPVLTVVVFFLPYLLILVLFTFLYLFVPNTRVRFRSALIGALVAGAIYQVVQWGYIRFQTKVTHFDVIYGSLAALPLLLIWLELSWMILLVGAELSFAHQNTERYEYATEAEQISRRMERLLTIYLLSELLQRGKVGATELAHTTTVPLCLVLELLNELVRVGLVAQDNEEYRAIGGISHWTIKQTWDRLDTYGCDLMLPIDWKPSLHHLSGFLARLGEAADQSTANIALSELK